MEDAADVMKWYREFITQAPEEMNGFFAMMTVPPGPPFPEELHLRKMCAIVWCYQGSMEQANTILESIRGYRPPGLRILRAHAISHAAGLFDGVYPAGLQWYWKADFFQELSDAAIEKHLEHGALLPTWQSTMHLYPVNGKVNRVGPADTAFSYRDAVWSGVIVGVDPDPANCAARSRLGQRLLRCAASVRRRRRLSEFHDGRRRRAHSRHLPGKLRPAGGGQSEVRSRKLLPRESEHPPRRRQPQF